MKFSVYIGHYKLSAARLFHCSSDLFTLVTLIMKVIQVRISKCYINILNRHCACVFIHVQEIVFTHPQQRNDELMSLKVMMKMSTTLKWMISLTTEMQGRTYPVISRKYLATTNHGKSIIPACNVKQWRSHFWFTYKLDDHIRIFC